MTRKEIMRVMPTNADDVGAARAVVQMGHPAVAPVLREMLRCMRVAQSPVADVFAAFFGELGEAAVPVIAEGLMRENCWLRHQIFTRVLPAWSPGAIRQLVNILTVVATQPDAYDNDLRSVAVLTQYRLADSEWLMKWIAFKKERLDVRGKLLTEREAELRDVQPGAAPNGGP
jgi:hypothetical protein